MAPQTKKATTFFFYSVSYRRGNVPPSLSSNTLPSIPVEKSEGRVGWSRESGSNNSDLYASLSLGRSFGLLRGREGKKTTALRMPRKQFLMPHTSSARLHSERTERRTEREEKEGESRTLLRFASATEEDGSDGRREGCLTGRRRYFLSFLQSKACKLQCTVSSSS